MNLKIDARVRREESAVANHAHEGEWSVSMMPLLGMLSKMSNKMFNRLGSWSCATDLREMPRKNLKRGWDAHGLQAP